MSKHGKLNSDTLGVFEKYEYWILENGERLFSSVDEAFMMRMLGYYQLAHPGKLYTITRSVFPTYVR